MPGSSSLSDNFSSLSYNVKSSKLPRWLYNPSSGQILGKTGSGWFKLLLFYGIFYAILALFWAGMMAVFLYFVVSNNIPMRTGQHSILKLNPGLGIRPQSDHNNVFIRYSPRDPQTYLPHVQSMDSFLEQYYKLEKKDKSLFADCKDGKKIPEDVNKICRFDLSQLGECTSKNMYGYSEKEPCVFIKMNKIYGWLPNPTTTIKHPLLKCGGLNPLDTENIGKLEYFPKIVNNNTDRGYYDNSFYPYIGQVDYVSPFVAVKFKNIKKGVIVHVTCSIENIPGLDESSDIKFEIAVDV